MTVSTGPSGRPEASRSSAPAVEIRSAEISGLPAIAFNRRWQTATFLFLLVITVVRLIQIGSFQLAPDEAYYWDWSRRLSLGYYDQGPMIAYVIRTTTAIFGVNEFGVRIGVLAASLGTLLCSYALARRLFSPMTGFLTVLLLGLSPLMEVGSLIATYDPVLVLFWALTVVWLERALFAERQAEQKRAWTLAGAATALGFLSKHTMLFIVPCLLLFLFASKSHRRWLARPEPYLAFLLVPLFYTGVIWWNAHNHWWTFRHLLFLVKKTDGTPLRRLGDLIGSQFLLIGPIPFFGGLVAAVRSFGLDDRTAGGQRCRFLAAMSLPVLVLFCVLSLKSKVQANWPACAWITPVILFSGWLTMQAGKSRSGAGKAAALTGFAVLMALTSTGIALSPALRGRLGIHLAPDRDVTNTVLGWRDLAKQVQKVRAEEETRGRKPFIVGNGYQICALMAFYLPDHPLTQDLFLHSRLDMYSAYVESLKQHFGEDAIYVDDSTVNDRDLKELFKSVEWDPPIQIWRRPDYAVPIRTLHIARCHRMRAYVGLKWANGG